MIKTFKSLSTKEMQIWATVRGHFTPSRLDATKGSSAQGQVMWNEIRTLFTAGGNGKCTATVGKNLAVSWNVKHTEILLPGSYPGDMETNAHPATWSVFIVLGRIHRGQGVAFLYRGPLPSNEERCTRSMDGRARHKQLHCRISFMWISRKGKTVQRAKCWRSH